MTGEVEAPVGLEVEAGAAGLLVRGQNRCGVQAVAADDRRRHDPAVDGLAGQCLRRAGHADSQARASAMAAEGKNSTGALRRSAPANINASLRHRSSPTIAIRLMESPCLM